MKLLSINPATEEVIDEFEVSDKKTVSNAVKKAKIVFNEWKKTDISERAKFIIDLAQNIKNHKNELTKIITSEMGKIISEAEGEIDETVNELEWFAKEGKKYLENEVVDVKNLNVKSYLRFDPLGVVGIITPWNFPLNNPLWKIAPALLAGNTIVWKPSELTPFVSIEIAKMFQNIGIPEGVFNLVLGTDDTGKYLVDSKVDMICLTGSSETGKKVASKAGKKLKKLVLELGGSNPSIVCNDADLDKAVEGAILGRFFNCGQVCSADKRFYVEKKIANDFIEKFVEKVKNLKVGNPLDSSINLGPLVSSEQRTKIEEQVNDSVNKGAKVLLGGKKPENLSKGYFYLPTVLTNVNHKMRVIKEETFGPVAPIISVKNMKEAIRLANDSLYGLGASIWTNNLEKAEDIAKELQVGMVWINDTNTVYPECPWGGVKESGIGRELSKYGILEFVNIKPIMIKHH